MPPIAVPRRTGSAACLMSSLLGRRRPIACSDDVARLEVVEVADDLGDAEDAHGEDGEIDAVGEERRAEGHALLACLEVGADRREQNADDDHDDGLEDRAARQHDREDEAHQHQRKVLGRAEDEGEPRQRHGQGRDEEGRHGAGEERAEGGDAEGDAGAALARHLMPVEGRHDGRRPRPGC